MSETPKRAYVTLNEAAIYYDVSIKTVRRWIARGALPAYQLPKAGGNVQGQLRVKLTDLEALAKPYTPGDPE